MERKVAVLKVATKQILVGAAMVEKSNANYQATLIVDIKTGVEM
jgi:hypothetical protein